MTKYELSENPGCLLRDSGPITHQNKAFSWNRKVYD